MNLRDQFLKAGLASKKQAEDAAREQRRQHKLEQGQRDAKRVLEQREAERIAQEKAAQEAERLARRKASEERARVETERLTVRHLLGAHRVRYRSGPQRFYHRSPDGREAWCLRVPEHLAEDLRAGRLAVAYDGDRVVIVGSDTADRVEALRPDAILFRNRGAVDPDPSQQLLEG